MLTINRRCWNAIFTNISNSASLRFGHINKTIFLVAVGEEFAVEINAMLSSLDSSLVDVYETETRENVTSECLAFQLSMHKNEWHSGVCGKESYRQNTEQ